MRSQTREFGRKTALEIAFLSWHEIDAKVILGEMARRNMKGSFESGALKTVQEWPDDRESWNGDVLCWATFNGFKKVITRILKAMPMLGFIARHPSGRTALQAAAEQGHLPVLRMLLSSGADIHASTAPIEGQTALQAAANQGHHDIERMLPSYKVETNAQYTLYLS